ncbi:MAG: uroporphyrinogen decarboxylase family protein [Phycisphaerae bacterium]
MTPREIIKTLLNKEIPERVGLNESFWPFICDNGWAEQGVPKGTDFAERFDLDIANVQWFWVPEPRPDLAETVEETDAWIVRKDGWGAIKKEWKGKAGVPEHVGFTITSPEVWKSDFREAALAIDLRKHTDLDGIRSTLQRLQAGDRFVTYSVPSVFEEMRRIMGDVTMLESLLLEKDFIHDFCTMITDMDVAYFQMLFEEVGLPDGIHVYDDLGYTQAPFASPACHREMVLPYHKRLVGLFKDHGLPVILHTCGDFRPHIAAIVEAGFDCIQALEAKTGMNVVDLAADWKEKLCFMGNLDVRAFESGDRERIRTECLTKLEGMKKLRAPYVFMSDHSIPPSVTVADYEYAQELFRQNCRY